MDIHQLEYFLDIAETGSVSRAAERHYLSQSTLSRELKQLEQRLGVRLFNYSKGEMRLTEEGILYMNGAQALLKEYRSGMEAIRQLQERKRDVIHVIVPPKAEYYFRRHIQSEFALQYPQIIWKISVGSFSMANEYIEQGFADLALGLAHRPVGLRVEAERVHKEFYYLALPAAHPVVDTIKNGQFTFSILERESFLVTKGQNDFHRFELAVFEQHQFVPRVTYEADTVQTIRQMVRDGLGIGLLPQDLIEQDLHDIYYMRLTPDYTINTFLLRARGVTNRPLVMALRRLILEQYRSLTV